MTGHPTNPPGDEQRRIGESVAAYDLMLDNMLTARQYFAGQREENPVVDRCAEVIDRNYAASREGRPPSTARDPGP